MQPVSNLRHLACKPCHYTTRILMNYLQCDSLEGGPELILINQAMIYQWKQNLATPYFAKLTQCLPAQFKLFLSVWFQVHSRITHMNKELQVGLCLHVDGNQFQHNFCNPITSALTKVCPRPVLFTLVNYFMLCKYYFWASYKWITSIITTVSLWQPWYNTN
jgi:hypothetical protein